MAQESFRMGMKIIVEKTEVQMVAKTRKDTVWEKGN